MANELNKIREKYGCKGEVIFRTSLQHVIDEGKALLGDENIVSGWFNEIDERHNKAEAEGKHLWMTRDFEKALIECAVEIAQVNTIEIIKYIQKEWLFYDYDSEVPYDRAIELLKNTINCTLEDADNHVEFARESLDYLGFNDNDIEALGFDEIFNSEEEY